jgi:hypothetical protein
MLIACLQSAHHCKARITEVQPPVRNKRNGAQTPTVHAHLTASPHVHCPQHMHASHTCTPHLSPAVLSLGVVMVFGAFLSTVWVKALVSYGESLIRCSILSTVVWFVLAAVAAALLRQGGGAVALMALAACTYCYYVLIDNRIEFAGKVRQRSCLNLKSRLEAAASVFSA